MVKTLTRLGNSSALVVPRAIMDLMEIQQDTPLKVIVEGRRMIVEPLSEKEQAERLTAIIERTGKKNAKLFRNLAE